MEPRKKRYWLYGLLLSMLGAVIVVIAALAEPEQAPRKVWGWEDRTANQKILLWNSIGWFTLLCGALVALSPVLSAARRKPTGVGWLEHFGRYIWRSDVPRYQRFILIVAPIATALILAFLYLLLRQHAQR